MGTQNPTIASTLAQKRDANTSQGKESQRPSKKQRPGTMMTKTMTMALCACLAAMLLASPALANRNLLGEMDDAMDAMNATMDMNMTANATEMANDTITDAAEEMPASDDGRRKLLEGHEGHSDGDDHSHSDDDTMDMMNDTMGNMTMNATEMANDTITDAAEEMPASDDGRRKLLEGHEGHSDGDDHSHSDDDTM